MNNKRQTIWLVSMLSLMVILSAYYLFTEDVTPTNKATDGTQQTVPSDGAAKASGGAAQGVKVTEVDSSTNSPTGSGSGAAAGISGGTDQSASSDPQASGAADSAAAGKTDSNTAGQTGQIADGSAVSQGDEAVLKEMSNLKGAQYFDELRRTHLERINKKNEELSSVIADTKNHTQEEASAAMEELGKLEEKDQRMTSLEEKLLQDYENAVVTEDTINFKVVVQAAKLEKKQAVRIIDLAAKELNVPPGRLSVQYVP